MISQQIQWPSKLIDKQFGETEFCEAHRHYVIYIYMCLGRLSLRELFSLKRDIGKVVEALYGESPPPIMIIGHSMGGAIAVHTAVANHVPSLLGLCVIDVVEGDTFVNY